MFLILQGRTDPGSRIRRFRNGRSGSYSPVHACLVRRDVSLGFEAEVEDIAGALFRETCHHATADSQLFGGILRVA